MLAALRDIRWWRATGKLVQRNLRPWGARFRRHWQTFLTHVPSVEMGNTLTNSLHVIRPKKRVLIFGYPRSGKTSLLYWLKLGEQIPSFSTIGVNQEDVSFGSVQCCVMDFGFCDYTSFKDTGDATIYVVGDDNLDIIKEHFRSILVDKPILVLANKQDLETAPSHNDVAKALELHTLEQPWKCIPVIINQGVGINNIRSWVELHINGGE